MGPEKEIRETETEKKREGNCVRERERDEAKDPLPLRNSVRKKTPVIGARAQFRPFSSRRILTRERSEPSFHFCT